MGSFLLSPLPVLAGAETNEHQLVVPEHLMYVRSVARELRPDAVERMVRAMPELTVRGTRFFLARAPTPDEVAALKKVADYYGCPFAATVRDEAEFSLARRLELARRTGRWN